MDVADVLDQLAGALCVAARPDVVDEHVGALGEVARAPGQDGTDVVGWSAAFGDLVPEATEGVGLLAAKVEVVMDDEDSSHLTPRHAVPGPADGDRLTTQCGRTPTPDGVTNVTH